MGCIDRENPAASPLLTVPTQPHGTARTPLFNDRNIGQYKHLVDWVYRASGAGVSLDTAVPAAHLEPNPPSSEATPAVYVSPGENDLVPGVELGPSWTDPLGHPEALELGPAQDLSHETSETPDSPERLLEAQQPEARREAASLGFEPRDPFDPEIFNRRFHQAPRAAVVPNRLLNPGPPGLD
jgi:hypothetical protein